jgi:hypothetical protein
VLSVAFFAGTFGRLVAATVAAAFTIALLKSSRTNRQLWIARVILAAFLAAGAILIVRYALPYPSDAGMPTFSIVASAAFIAGLAVEELIGTDIRKLLGIKVDADR